MFRKQTIHNIDFQELCNNAVQWVDNYETIETELDTFTVINIPRKGAKGAISYILKKIVGAEGFVLKISKKNTKYGNTKMKKHLGKLFEYVSKFEHQDVIVIPLYAQVINNRLCMVFPLCEAMNKQTKKALKVKCDDNEKHRKLFQLVQYLHKGNYVGFDIKVDNLLSCVAGYSMTDYENCISNIYHDTLPDISVNFNINWKGVDKALVRQKFDEYKYYWMALDYIAFFCMITRYTFGIGMSIFVTDFVIEEQQKYINEKRVRGRIDQCAYNILKHVITLLKDPLKVETYDTLQFSMLLGKRRNAIPIQQRSNSNLKF
ncbi:MAG: hypothetical protein CMH46_00180 [Muricauda sp.]|nr:hypothetical protein [Allomuricauda sp.]MAU13939.1 hypothetical protein [Allomuricauda sp.]